MRCARQVTHSLALPGLVLVQAVGQAAQLGVRISRTCHYNQGPTPGLPHLQINGASVGGQTLKVELPWADLGGQPDAVAPAPSATAAAGGASAATPLPGNTGFKLLVANVGDAMPADELCAYFRCSFLGAGT